VQRVITNNFRQRQEGAAKEAVYPHLRKYKFNEKKLKAAIRAGFKTKTLAFTIFLFHFIEFGALGLIPDKFLLVYRSVRISDLLLYSLICYSIICYKEYKDLLKSRSFKLPAIFLSYMLIEFGVSYLRYGFNPFEYFFRLKGLWTSFLIFPYMLLLKRNGFPFLIKIIFPIALISNVLYILSALTGIPFLAGVNIISARLPGDIEVFRVFGGTFFGELFFMGFIYYWITQKFKLWQLFPAVLFILPHVLALGRMAWAFFIFTILLLLLSNTLRRRNFRVLFKQAFILIVLSLTLIFTFIQFIPESEFYIDALKARLSQGQGDIQYSEGTYGTRIITQNDALIKLWSENDIMLGIGMHPMWVVKPESREEAVYYGAFSDVTWPSVLAAYGLIGLALALIMQFYFIFVCIKSIKKVPQPTINGLFMNVFLSRLLFDVAIGFSYMLVSTTLWGFNFVNYLIPFMVYSYEYVNKQNKENSNAPIS
jgi:hypothetical protein